MNGKVGNFEVLGGRRPVGGHRRLTDEESLTFAALDAMGRKDGDELRHGRAGAQHALLVAVAVPPALWIRSFYELKHSNIKILGWKVAGTKLGASKGFSLNNLR